MDTDEWILFTPHNFCHVRSLRRENTLRGELQQKKRTALHSTFSLEKYEATTFTWNIVHERVVEHGSAFLYISMYKEIKKCQIYDDNQSTKFIEIYRNLKKLKCKVREQIYDAQKKTCFYLHYFIPFHFYIFIYFCTFYIIYIF